MVVVSEGESEFVSEGVAEQAEPRAAADPGGGYGIDRSGAAREFVEAVGVGGAGV